MPAPTHPKALQYARLFRGVKRFEELEGKIEALPTPNERGAAFEVFAEAYLATTRKMQAKSVWSDTSAPIKLAKKFKLPFPEKGADGLFETVSGEYHAYQVKFRTKRPSLTWGELSTFVGITDHLDHRLLITNCNTIAKDLYERKGFYSVRGNDLDRLERADFLAMAAWLRGDARKAKKKKPRPHQAQALKQIVDAFEGKQRATALMACGTGKTLVGLWVAEELDAKRVLVLVPSLALMRQTLDEWMHETRWEDVAFLCVCSDPTVKGEDALQMRAADMDFPVSTDSETVSSFLRKPYSGTKVIFSTYQSSPVVAQGMSKSAKFDIGIFDEAHKTAGRSGTRFSFALKNTNIKVRKRLFMTATARHYDVRKTDKEGDLKMVFSMDVPETYGTVAYSLNFAEAAKRNIICDYEVLVSVITTEMVNDALLSKGEVLVKDDLVRARQVATQLAIEQAVDKYGASKIITFHRVVAAAKSYASDESEGLRTHLPEFSTFHVNGSMTTSMREDLIKAFRQAERGVITNARCLTEGVDVPVVDMVAFIAPKRSRIDIVQATGRAMRKIKGKTTGYVLVPLFVEQEAGESVEEAVQRTAFDEIWSVLQAMQEQDEDLAQIISEMRQERGRTGGYDEGKFGDKLTILGPDLSLPILREAITTSVVDRMGTSWDERYGELVAYKERFGDCDVPSEWPENQGLASWVSLHRSWYNTGKISKERFRCLDELGFTWDPREKFWNKMFLALEEYKALYGDCMVPSTWDDNPQLRGWVIGQRTGRKKGLLTTNKIQKLQQLGFIWDPYGDEWEEKYKELEEFQKTFGHCDVPYKSPENRKLYTWTVMQRTQWRTGDLVAARVKRLISLGFIFDPFTHQWDSKYEELIRFHQKFGHTTIPYNDQNYKSLRGWAGHQRTNYKKGKLTKEMVARLEALGMVLDTEQALEDHWLNMYDKLKAFKGNSGHCNVPANWAADPKLAEWVAVQRMSHRSGKLRLDRKECLEEIDFVWNTIEAAWEEFFLRLSKFAAETGHCRVPSLTKQDKSLWNWVHRQRRDWRKGKLTREQITRLESIGIVWDILEERWQENFLALVRYEKNYGNCLVPSTWTENKQLSGWVVKQRDDFRQNKISQDRVKQLENIGFVWDPYQHQWDEMFSCLLVYKKQAGDCLVPNNWPENQSLANWVGIQRNDYRKNELSTERTAALEKIGFVWDAQAYRWNEMYTALVDYEQKHGDCLVPSDWPQNKLLANWIDAQRQLYRSGHLIDESIKLLDKIGFIWHVNDSRWDVNYQNLLLYKEQHGDCLVPSAWSHNKKLANWVSAQRQFYRKGNLTKERTDLLESIGFIWDASRVHKKSNK